MKKNSKLLHKSAMFPVLILFMLLLCYDTQAQKVFTGKIIKSNNLRSNTLSQYFKDFTIAEIDISTLNEYVKSQALYSSFKLKIGKQIDWNIYLELNDLRAVGYYATRTTEKGIIREPLKLPDTYKGNLDGGATGEVRLTINQDKIQGYIMQADELIYIEPLEKFIPNAEERLFLLYKRSDLIEQAETKCGVAEIEKQKKIIDTEQDYRTNGSECLVLEIATDADYQYFQTYGSNSNQEILSIMNQVEGLYESTFGLNFSVTFQNVYDTTSNDPYTEFDCCEARDEFRNEWNANRGNITRDLAHLFSGKDFDDNCIGCAYIGNVCDNNGYSVTQDYGINTFFTVAHEMGHNFNGIHTEGENCGQSNRTVMCQGATNGWTFSTDNQTRINNFMNSVNSCIEIAENLVTGVQNITNGSTTFFAADLLETSNPFTVNANASATLIAGHEIIIYPGLHAKNGCNFHAYIDADISTNCGSNSRIASVSDLRTSEKEYVEDIASTKRSIPFRETPVSFKVYPNPFSDNTTIEYEITDDNTSVTIAIFNVMGQIISIPLNNVQKQVGNYRVSFDGSRLPDGIYYCRLKAGDQVITIKMILTEN